MDDGIFSWDTETDTHMNAFIKELERYGIKTKSYPPGNVSARLPGGKYIEIIYTKASEGRTVTGMKRPDMRESQGELTFDPMWMLPMTMVFCKVCRDYEEDVKDEDLEELARFKEIFSAQAGKLFKESGPFALIAEYGITPKELDFIDSFSL